MHAILLPAALAGCLSLPAIAADSLPADSLSTGDLTSEYDGLYLGVKPVAADIEHEQASGLPLGGSATLGYSRGGASIEYEHLKLTSIDLGASLFANWMAASADEPEDVDIYSHGLFVGYRAGGWVFAKVRAGYRHLRFKEDAGERRVLDEDWGAAGGVGVGLRGRHAMLELDYTVLDSDFKYWGLGLSVVF